MDVEVVRPSELSAEQVSLWSEFQKCGPDLVSPYLSPAWAKAVETAQGAKSNVRVAILHENGEIRGFFPARVKSGMAMPAGAPMCDYQGLVAPTDVTIDPKKLLSALRVWRFDFSHMPVSQGSFASHVRGAQPSWIARLPFGYESYAHDKNEESGVLKDLARRRRKLEKQHGEPVFTAFSRSSADFDLLLDWKREQWRKTGQTDIFAAGWTERLLRDLLASRDPDFGGVLYTLHIDHKLAAAQFNLRSNNVIHAWIISHDESHEKFSPGLLLFQDIMRWMDDTPYSSIDFGPGDYRFKRQLSNDACMMGHGFVGRPSPASLVRSAAYGIRDAAERLPLGKVSALPGKAMRRYDLLRGLR